MDDRSRELEALLGVLLREEVALAGLVGLALEEQAALVQSDFTAIERTSAAMAAAADHLDALDAERLRLVLSLGADESLVDVPTPGDGPAVGAARTRLAARALELRDIQEANARLILDAVRLRERWYALLAGMTAPTYGSAGRQELATGRGMVSKTA